jgi:putative membrane protein
MLYLYLKAFHIITVISWMAGMLYLPRLFVYHTAAEPGSAQAKTFEVMEHRLLTYIMTPAMALTWILGIALMLQGGWLAAGWLHAKLLLVLIMSGVHGFLSRCARDFAHGRNRRTQKFYRIINEIPTILMILIVILVVVKPF